MRRALPAALALALVAPAPAPAAPPILPLPAVAPQMRCSGLTVVRGLQVSAFDVEVIDVVDRARGPAARILVRVGGPAVAATGLGPGFSGSPILCPGADGVARTIGAISETIGEYGGLTALATPIEAILAQPPLPPAATRTRVVGARPLAGPLTIAGLRPALARGFARAARRRGHTLLAAPAGTLAAFDPQPLAQGASVAAGMTTGDVSLSSLGTVAYADGPHVWAFGHALDGAGRRALFLQDAFVHTVVNHPLGAGDVATYKLGSPGNVAGAITSDGPHAVVGTVGAPPPSFPLRVTARDLDGGRTRSGLTRVADEGAVGRPSGVSALSLAAAAATAEAAVTAAAGSPARQSGDLCVRVELRELRAPLRACNRYAVDGGGPNALAGAAAADVGEAVALLEGYRFETLHPTLVEIGLRVRAGLRQAFIVGAQAPRAARPGETLRVRLRLRHVGSGRRSTRTVRVRVPADAPRGARTLRLAGTPADRGVDPAEGGDGLLEVVFEDELADEETGPETLAQLRERFARLARYDGVTAHLGGRALRVLRDPRLRISGSARVRLRVR